MKKMKGFTLIELLIALVILGIMAAGLLPALASITKQSFGSEIAFSAPSVAQSAVNNVKTSSTYTDLTNPALITISATYGLMMTTVTVQQSDYTYNISSLSSARGAGALAMLNQGDAVITGTEGFGESQSHYELTSSVINPDYTEPCDSNSTNTATWNKQVGAFEVSANGTTVINYSVALDASDLSSITVEFVNAKVAAPKKDYIDIEYWGNNWKAGQICNSKGQGGVGNAETLAATSTTIDLSSLTGGGSGKRFSWLNENMTTASYTFTGLGKKGYWHMNFHTEFADQNGIIRIYVPDATKLITIPSGSILVSYRFPEGAGLPANMERWDSLIVSFPSSSDVEKAIVSFDNENVDFRYSIVVDNPSQKITIPIGQLDLNLAPLKIEILLEPKQGKTLHENQFPSILVNYWVKS